MLMSMVEYCSAICGTLWLLERLLDLRVILFIVLGNCGNINVLILLVIGIMGDLISLL